MPPKSACANPLFLKWLEELRDNAREKGLKVVDVYNKGCRSLQHCPIRYERPRDLSVLAGIGPKTISELDKKFRAHCAATGEPYPSDPPRAALARKERTQHSDEEEEQKDSEEEAPPPKKKRKTNPRPYIPAPRSGAYGILIGMLVAQENPDDAIDEQLTRGEIVRHAQAYCDSSYDRSEKGTFMTAWNGMKTLVSKGYVSVQGMPHRYCLTHDGFCDVAVVIRNMAEEFKGQPQLVPFRLRGEDSGSRNDFSGDPSSRAPASSNTRLPNPSAVTYPREPASERFRFCYIDVRGRQVSTMQEARTRLCPIDFITLRRIEFLANQRTHPISKQLRLIDETETLHPSGRITLFAYIVEDAAPPQCSGFSDHGPAPGPKVVASSDKPAKSSVLPATRMPATPLSKAASAPVVTSNAIAGPSRSLLPNEAAPQRSASLAGSSYTPSTRDVRPPSHRLSEQLPLPGEYREAPDFDPANAIVFPEGTYEVILVLDTREVESKDKRDAIQEALERKGVKVETRALRLGDMCWIARRHDAYGAEADECVLDFVVERKRLDDLCTSIKDGRYNEQCFRLGQSGIKNVFYIVEDYQKAARMQIFGKAILTAKSQIQVINGFYLKETHKLNDTIDYLVTMTKVIKQTTHDLRIIPPRYIDRNTYTALQKKLRATYPKEAFLTSFEAFQTLNKKSTLKTVKEYLARMLLRIKGMSPERVSAVLDVWETPRALFEAMRARHEVGLVYQGKKAIGPEMMFAEQVPGEGRRKIGNALSKEMWLMLWGCVPDLDGVRPQTQARDMAKDNSQSHSRTTTADTRSGTGVSPTIPAGLNVGKGKSTPPQPSKYVAPSAAKQSAADKLRAELWNEIGRGYDLPGAAPRKTPSAKTPTFSPSDLPQIKSIETVLPREILAQASRARIQISRQSEPIVIIDDDDDDND